MTEPTDSASTAKRAATSTISPACWTTQDPEQHTGHSGNHAWARQSVAGTPSSRTRRPTLPMGARNER